MRVTTKATAEAAIPVQTTPPIQRSDNGRRRKRRKRGRGRRNKTRRRGAATTTTGWKSTFQIDAMKMKVVRKRRRLGGKANGDDGRGVKRKRNSSRL